MKQKDKNLDLFAHKAQEYDKGSQRVANVTAIVETIKRQIGLKKDMHLMDFGAGTGLLLAGIAPYVYKITAIDVSSSMIAELENKRANLPCELEILPVDLTMNDVCVDDRFDGIISSMTLHHIANIPAIFTKFKDLLKPNGFLALADLDSEDGSFHDKGQDTGVYHFGFDREYISQVAQNTGFINVETTTANTFEKNGRDYSVFLLSGMKH